MTQVNFAIGGLGAVVTASASQGGFPPAQANDGSTITYWRTPTSSSPDWVTVDLGAPQYIESVMLKGVVGSYTTAHSLYYSNDNATWNWLATFTGQYGDLETLTGGITARYFSLRGTLLTSRWIGVSEFQCWGPAEAPPPPTTPIPEYIEAWLDGIEANFVPTIQDWLAANP